MYKNIILDSLPNLNDKDILEMSNAVSDVVSIYVKVGQLASDQLVDIIISDIQPVLLFLL